MPANLPPQYFEAEKNFRAAKSPTEKIAGLEEMLAIMPKHKGTDHLRAELRSRIAKLTQLAAKKSGGQRASMIIEREGAGQVAIVGLPNAGKSQLVASITNASPAVADYAFTTYAASPAMMEFENIKIQLIDTPPLVPQAIEWWLPPILKRADALLVMVDLSEAPLVQMAEIISQLENMRIGIGEAKSDPEVVLSRKKAIIIGNKLDKDGARQNYDQLQARYGAHLPMMAVSAAKNTGLEELRRRIYDMLAILRVYTKAPGEKPDFADPIILGTGDTMADAAESVHKDFRARLKYARVWGSGKHDGIMVKRDHVLEDGDVIELHM
ncbi:MAG: 50S ribosome-binding GTPase [Chloroflexi bacterium]|nr:50S ribosome-binding GTPase [Chloroflexota bacterium]